jgi:xanthine dehydrogenase accessory factor
MTSRPEGSGEPQGGAPVSRSRVLVEAGRLAGEGKPYALATVVRVVRPASTRRGDRALVTPDGALAGWVGGACSEPIVIREALRALADGEPRLVQIGPAGAGAGAPEDVVVAESRCASEGVVEVLIEPELPGPLLAVLGEGVAGRTLLQLARIVGWRVTDQLDPDTAADAVVVATMGHGDEDALASALKAGVGYVGLVASARRAGVVLDALRQRGVEEEALARVRSPAGRDLGSSTQEEIAVAILAELVEWRHGLAAPANQAPAEAVDPVCGMTVVVAGAPTAVRDGVTWYFCSIGCRDRFEATGGP